jgi:hypothetical protein
MYQPPQNPDEPTASSQQPYSQYPPQQPYYPGDNQPTYQTPPQYTQYPPQFAPPPPPKRKRPIWLWVIVGIAILIVISQLGKAMISPQPETSTPPAATSQPTYPPLPTLIPTSTPTHVLKWTTVQTFHGNGNKKTGNFDVPDSWRLAWSCTPSSSYGGSYNVIVDVDNSDGTSLDPGAINTICAKGNT